FLACPKTRFKHLAWSSISMRSSETSARWATMPKRTTCATARTEKCTNPSTCSACSKSSVGAIGVCCQKVSEAEVFARGGIKDVLVSNQVRDRAKIDRLARLPRYGARITVCIDDLANVADLSAAAQKHGTTVECLVEVDCGAGRCGVSTVSEVLAIAHSIDSAPGLKFTPRTIRRPKGQARRRDRSGSESGRSFEKGRTQS